jgi:GNAT superfamily N-acetyltransferase
MQDLNIRDAADSDLPALCALRDAWEQHEAKLLEAAVGTSRFLVAVSGLELVGFASVHIRQPLTAAPKSRIPKLSDCLVGPAYRSLGIGRALVAARECIVRDAGCEKLYVSVDPIENAWWFEFFRRRGYRPLQEAPYRKRESRHLAGRITTVEAWRQDLMMDLKN